MGFFQDTTNKEVNNSLWVEKYRPQKLEEYVGNEHLKQKVNDYLQSGDIPHLLFFGKAGTGKLANVEGLQGRLQFQENVQQGFEIESQKDAMERMQGDEGLGNMDLMKMMQMMGAPGAPAPTKDSDEPEGPEGPEDPESDECKKVATDVEPVETETTVVKEE